MYFIFLPRSEAEGRGAGCSASSPPPDLKTQSRSAAPPPLLLLLLPAASRHRATTAVPGRPANTRGSSTTYAVSVS